MKKDMVRGVALITGGAQGIGKAIAAHLTGCGYSVVIADMDAEAAKEAARELGLAMHARLDVADESAVKALLKDISARYSRLDALVNNAGVAHGFGTPLEKLSLKDWQRVIATNLTGAFLCAKHASRLLRKSKGAIINIASTRAIQSEPNTEAYSASKGGIVALTHALAMSLAPEVRVNCISPGWIVVDEWQKRSKRHAPKLKPEDHGQHPCGRVGRPEDVAEMVEYLIERAGFVTGQNFVMDGGMTKKMIYVE